MNLDSGITPIRRGAENRL